MSERDLIFLCVGDEKREGEKEEFDRELKRGWCTWEEMSRSSACCRGEGMCCGGTGWECSLL